MQSLEFLQLLGWISIIVGILIICLAWIRISSLSSDDGYRETTENKGVILLGPIPIVWGYGRKGWYVAGIIGIVLFIIWLLIL